MLQADWCCHLAWQAVVSVPRIFRHPLVDKDIKRRTKIWAHDEFNLCSVGDMVHACGLTMPAPPPGVLGQLAPPITDVLRCD